VINGVNNPTNPGFVAASIVSQQAPSQKVNNANVAARPDWQQTSSGSKKKPDNSGAYVHDDSGKYKGN
jgi:hypothetical protein